jgi:hypothetical protein
MRKKDIYLKFFIVNSEMGRKISEQGGDLRKKKNKPGYTQAMHISILLNFAPILLAQCWQCWPTGGPVTRLYLMFFPFSWGRT